MFIYPGFIAITVIECIDVKDANKMILKFWRYQIKHKAVLLKTVSKLLM